MLHDVLYNVLMAIRPKPYKMIYTLHPLSSLSFEGCKELCSQEALSNTSGSAVAEICPLDSDSIWSSIVLGCGILQMALVDNSVSSSGHDRALE